MTVSVTSPISGPYFPNGVTTAFPFDFKAMSTSEVAIVDPDGVAITAYGFSVELDATEGGTINFAAAPTAMQIPEFLIVSAPAFEQPTVYGATTAFNPTSLNGPIDRLAVQNVYMKALLDRLLPGQSLLTEGLAGKFLSWDAGGDPIASTGTGADAGLRTDLAASTGASLSSFIQSGASATATTVQDELRFTLRPEQFTGPSDAEKINQAITAANALGGAIVELKSGNYNIDQPVLLKSKVALCGKGMKRTTLTQTSTNAAWAAYTTSTGIVSTLNGAEYDNLEVSGFTVIGLNSTPVADGAGTYAKNGISIVNAWNSVVRDCYVKDTSTGIIFSGTVSGVVWYNNLIEGCLTENCRSWNAAGNAGAPRGQTMGTNRSSVRDCVSDNCYTGFFDGSDYSEWTNCRTSRSTDDGFYINANYSTYIGCWAIGAATRAAAAGSGFAVNPTTGTKLIGCNALRYPNAGVRFRHTTVGPSAATVQGCYFEDCGYGFLDDLTGISAYPGGMSTGNVFIGNTAKGCQRSGLRFDRQRNGVFSGNTAYDNSQAGVTVSTRGGIAFGEYCLNNRGSDNQCYDTQTGAETQTFGFYVYAAADSGAGVENTGNIFVHKSLFGTDRYNPRHQEGTVSPTIASGTRVITGSITFPQPFESAPTSLSGSIKTASVLADAEQPAAVNFYNLTATGCSYRVDAFANVGADRALSVGWMARLAL